MSSLDIICLGFFVTQSALIFYTFDILYVFRYTQTPEI
jgi:hypothetical protein